MSSAEESLRLLAGKFRSGPEFFRLAARALAVRTGCRWSGIGELNKDGISVDLLAFWDRDHNAEPFSFQLQGSPCLQVYESNAEDPHKFFPRDVARQFADFPMLDALGARSYRGEVFYDAEDRPTGHVFVISESEEEDGAEIREFFRLVAQRVGAEYNRWQTTAALAASEQSLRWYEIMATTTSDRMTIIDSSYIYRAINDSYLREAPFRKRANGEPWTRDAVVGHPISEVLEPILAREVIKPNLERCCAGHDLNLEGWILGPGEDRRFLQRNYRPIRTEDGSVAGAAVTIRDLTRRQLRIAWLADLAVDMTVIDGDFVTAAGKVTAGLIEHLDIARVGIWIGEEASETLTNLSLASDPSLKVSRPEPESGTVLTLARPEEFYAALASGTASRNHDPASPIRESRALGDQPAPLAVTSVLDVPIRVSGETIGLIRAEQIDSPRIWQADEITFVGEAAFLMVQTALHHERRLEQSIAKRERAASRRLSTLVNQRTAEIEERQQLVDELATKNEELEAKNAEIESFTYAVSHDLKSPLFTIKGFLGSLQRDIRGGDSQRVQRDIERIQSAAGTMQQLLDALLKLSRFGRTEVSLEPVSLRELAQETLDLLDGKITERGVEVDIADDLPTVIGNRAHLRQLLQNLVENAIKFMGSQPRPRIEIAVGRQGQEGVDEGVDEVGVNGAGKSRISATYVKDNGIGIDPRYQDKIFGLFERLDLKSQGTGIGLAIVERIAKAHGGSAWAESAGPNQGSTFWFSLPTYTEDR